MARPPPRGAANGLRFGHFRRVHSCCTHQRNALLSSPGQFPVSSAMKLLSVSIALLSAVAPTLHAQGSSVSLLNYRTDVPAGWVARTPSSSMRLAEYVLPTTADGSGEVVVFYFGPAMGGNVEANLARWKGQFSNPDGSPVVQTVTRDSSGAFPLTFAEYRGSYRRGIGAGSADSIRTGQQLIAGIAETPRGTLFIQLFGPAARVVAERDTFIRFVKGLK
jgi:hypothetical protein